MDFLNPLLLWGLLGISVPILIHILNRFRFRQVDWAAMELLRRALVVRSRRVRIEDMVLLALRCLAIGLIALAFSRPAWRPDAQTATGSSSDVAAIVALDGSFSMSHRPGVRSRFERALERLNDVRGVLPRGTPMSLLLIGDQPRIVLRNVGYEEDRLADALEDLGPLPERLQLEAAFEEILGLLTEVRAPSRECYLITDGQATSWKEPSEKARALLGEVAKTSNVFCLPVSVSGEENVSVERLERASGSVWSGGMARFLATVRNAGGSPQESLPVRLLLDGTAVDERVIDRLAPGERADVSLFARFSSGGLARMTATTEEDPLTRDNSRYLSVHVPQELRVLCVDGTPGATSSSDEARYLETALTARRESADARADLVVRTIAWTDLPTEDVNPYGAIFLVDVPDIHPEEAASLHRFVTRGGGLFFFLGGNAQADLLNAHLLAKDTGILPARILDRRGLGESSEGIVPLLGSVDGRDAGSTPPTGDAPRLVPGRHPLSLALRNLRAELLDEARFFHRHGLEPVPGATALWTVAGSDEPLLCERRVGSGKALVLGSSADPRWSNIATHPLYPILVREALALLTRRADELPVGVGSRIRVALPSTGLEARVTLMDPKGRESTLQSVFEGGRTVAELARAEDPGFYTFTETSVANSAVFAVNVDTQESDVRCLTPEELSEALSLPRVRVVPEGQDLATIVKETRVGREFWWELLLAGLLVLLLESFLAHRFSRKVAKGG